MKPRAVDGDREDFAVLRACQHDLDSRAIRTIFLGKDEHEIELFRARFDRFAFVAAHAVEKIRKTLRGLSLGDDSCRCDFRGLARHQLQTTARGSTNNANSSATNQRALRFKLGCMFGKGAKPMPRVDFHAGCKSQ